MNALALMDAVHQAFDHRAAARLEDVATRDDLSFAMAAFLQDYAGETLVTLERFAVVHSHPHYTAEVHLLASPPTDLFTLLTRQDNVVTEEEGANTSYSWAMDETLEFTLTHWKE